MPLIASVLVAVVALLHAWFLVLEMVLWRRPLRLRTFGMTAEQAEATSVMAANQGLYNGFLAAGLVVGLLAAGPTGFYFRLFFLPCVMNASPDFVLRGGRLGQLLAKPIWPVVLEITEHSRIDDYDALRSALQALNSGIRVAVDDAGAGFSSLRHILELKPAFAKLDMALVQGIEHDTVRQALVAGLAYFARHSDCSLIAEGVETAAEAATLERLGIGLAQGYLFGLPAALN